MNDDDMFKEYAKLDDGEHPFPLEVILALMNEVAEKDTIIVHIEGDWHTGTNRLTKRMYKKIMKNTFGKDYKRYMK